MLGASKTRLDLRVILQSGKSSTKWSWHPQLQRAAPTREERGALHYMVSISHQRPLEIPRVPRVLLSVLSAWNRSGAESLATPSGVSRTATSVVSCRSSTSGHWASSSKLTRGQSWETGSLSTLFSSVDTTAKCISLGPADCRERLSYSVRRSAAAFQRNFSHISESWAGSGIRTRSDHSLEEGGHRGGPSSWQGVWVLQPVLHCSKEGWGLRPILNLQLLNHSCVWS